MREQHPELDLRGEPPRRGEPAASAAAGRAVTREFGRRLADYAGPGTLGLAFAFDLVARPPVAKTPVAEPPQGAAGDIKGSEAPLR